MSAYNESEILQIHALITNGAPSCIRAGTWDTECIYICISSTTITGNTERKRMHLQLNANYSPKTSLLSEALIG